MPKQTIVMSFAKFFLYFCTYYVQRNKIIICIKMKKIIALLAILVLS